MSTILVVDDDPDIRALLRHKLTAAGYDVILADDGDVAQRTVRSRGADLILTDIRMPRMSGDEFVASLRHGSSLPPIPVIYLTAIEPDAELAVRTLGYPLLAKPVQEKELLALVARQIRPRPAP